MRDLLKVGKLRGWGGFAGQHANGDCGVRRSAPTRAAAGRRGEARLLSRRRCRHAPRLVHVVEREQDTVGAFGRSLGSGPIRSMGNAFTAA